MKGWISWESTYRSGMKRKEEKVEGRWEKGRVINWAGIKSSDYFTRLKDAGKSKRSSGRSIMI